MSPKTAKMLARAYPDLEILDVSDQGDRLWVSAKLRRDPEDRPPCPTCGARPNRHGPTHPTVFDWIGRPVTLSLTQRRWLCREHGTWLEPLPIRSDRHPKMSQRLLEEVVKLLTRGITSEAIATRTGISRQLVDRVRREQDIPRTRKTNK